MRLGSTDSDVLTIRQLSRYLQITPSTLYKLVEAGRLPGKKVGRQWRFHRDVIDDWLAQRSESDQPVKTGHSMGSLALRRATRQRKRSK